MNEAGGPPKGKENNTVGSCVTRDRPKQERTSKIKASKKSGFTLIELLVVVAIIAVIGAGVAVTYNRLDERAKVAMEMNDIGVLEKTISHWSFLHNGNLPNRLDSLIETDGSTLYSAMTGANGYGLSMQAGFTFEAVKAPEYVLSQLSVAGIDTVYMHYNNVSSANDSTYTNDTTAAKTVRRDAVL